VLVAQLREQRVIAVDTETTSLRVVDADLVGLAFAWRAGEAGTCRCAATWPARSTRTRRSRRCGRARGRGVTKVGQNLKYDLSVLEGAGVTCAGRCSTP
jgi:DNA polymerase I